MTILDGSPPGPNVGRGSRLWAFLFLGLPRISCVCLLFLSNYPWSKFPAYSWEGKGILLLMLCLPLTTLAYSWMWNTGRNVTDDINFLILGIAALVDLGGGYCAMSQLE
jgi:hypothetical protein